MKSKYREIDPLVRNIDDAVKILHEYKIRGELVYIVFNGKELYSDQDDVESAYIKCLGKTKAEFDDMVDRGYKKHLGEDYKEKYKY